MILKILGLALLLGSSAPASTLVLDFEDLFDGTSVDATYPGVTFQNALVLTAGVSLNELESPPHSGFNVILDANGPVTLQFLSPIIGFRGYFTYVEQLLLVALDGGGTVLDNAMTQFVNNTALSGDSGSSPNELVSLTGGAISTIQISGNLSGFSFIADDFAFDQAATGVPEPGAAYFVAAAVLGLLWRHKRSRQAGFCCLTILAIAVTAHAAPSVTVAVSPSVADAGVATNILVTATIADPTVIAAGVNLLRVDSAGRTLSMLGVLHDDGRNGDLLANDKIFSLAITVNEPSAGQVFVRVSAPFQGQLQRVLSNIAAIAVNPAPGLPPNPATVAPALSRSSLTPMAEATAFLYLGANPIQTGADPTKFIAAAAGVLRGRVLARDGKPLPGVTVTILKRPEFGKTMTRADGWFDLAVNAGGILTVDYNKAGFLNSQRQVSTEWQSFRVVPDVVLIPPDPNGTFVDTQQPFDFVVVRGPQINDADGPRRPTLLFPHGTQTSLLMPDGSRRPLPTFTVRISEFTVGESGPAAMPGSLPPASKYTYAAELSVDEATAAGAKTVEFSAPVIHYMENFLAWPVGEATPVGYFDRDRGVWSGTPDGRVVRILSANQGLAVLDVNGSGQPMTAVERLALGITSEEERQLLLLYQPGQSLWRVRLMHFSSIDINGSNPAVAAGATGPTLIGRVAAALNEQGCSSPGSIIDCQNQALGERVPITGTPWSLHYSSARQPGRRTAANTLIVPLTSAIPPPALAAVGLGLSVAGQAFFFCYGSGANQTATFTWDGLDAYGRAALGAQKVSATTYYFYPPLGGGFGSTPGGGGGSGPNAVQGFISFAEFSQIPDSAIGTNRSFPMQSICGRAAFSIKKDWTAVLNGGDARGNSIGGWSLSAHHFFDALGQVLILGDGTQRSLNMPAMQNRVTMMPEGRCRTDGFDFGVGDGGQVSKACVLPEMVAYAPDGSYYMANAARIRKVTPNGIITTVSGDVSAAPLNQSGDGGPASNGRMVQIKDITVGPGGDLFFIDDQRIRRIGTDGIIRAFAGTGQKGFSGDGGPATAALFNSPSRIAISPDGTVYVTDSGNFRIRKINVDGVIKTIAGTGGNPTTVINNRPATGQPITQPVGIALTAAGDVIFSEIGSQFGGPGGTPIPSRIRMITTDGMMQTLAGTGWGYGGDGELAVLAGISNGVNDVTVGVDGSIYFLDVGPAARCVRQITPGGLMLRYVGSPFGALGNGTYNTTALQTSIDRLSNLEFAPNGTLHFVEVNSFLHLQLSGPFPGFGLGDAVVGSEDGSELYVFNQFGQHLRTLDPWTGATILTFAYDAERRLTTITDAYANTARIERDVAGTPLAIMSAYGLRTPLSVGADGMIGAITNPAGESTRFTYASGLMLTMTDARDKSHTFQYDADGRLIFDANPAGGSKTLTRTGTPQNYEVAVRTAMGRVRKYAVDTTTPTEEKQLVTDADGLATPATTRTDGSLLVQNPNLSSVSLVRSGDPRWSMASPFNSSYQFRLPGGLVYNETSTRNVLLSDQTNPFSLASIQYQTSRNGKVFQLNYDAPSRGMRMVAPSGRALAIQLDANGRITQTQRGNLTPIEYSYDTRGRLSSIAQGSGTDRRITTLGYDGAGFLNSLADPLGRVTQFTTDAAGRVRSQMLPGLRPLSFEYDKAGNLTSLTPPGQPAHTFTYNAINQPASYTAPAVAGGGTNTSDTAYNVDRQMQTFRRADGKQLDFSYDAAGRAKTLSFADDQYTFNFSAITGQVNSVTAIKSVNVSFDYDGPLPKSTTWTGSINGTVARTFDADLRLSSTRVNSAPAVVYQYDVDGRVSKAGELVVSRNTQTGLVQSTSLDQITDNFTYNGFGEAMSYNASGPAGLLYSVTFQRDKRSRITQKIETVAGVTTVQNYEYDEAGHLFRVLTVGGSPDEYLYDWNGNRTSRNGAETGSYDGQDRLLQYGTTSFSYSAAGDLRSKTAAGQATAYEYDVFGNLRRVTLPDGRVIDYMIDALNRRVGKSVNGAIVKTWLYESSLRPAAELDASGNVTSFVYATNSNVPSYMVKGGTRYRVIADQVGSVRLVVNAATGAVVQAVNYDSFGRVLSDSNAGFQPFGFAGGLYDSDTGLVRFGVRDYDATTGRWTRKDPLGFSSKTSNLYSYVHSDPINAKDPTGLETVEVSIYDGVGGGISVSYSESEGLVVAFEVGFGEGVGVSYSPEAIAVPRDSYGQAEATMTLFLEAEVSFMGVHGVANASSTQSCKNGDLAFGPLEGEQRLCVGPLCIGDQPTVNFDPDDMKPETKVNGEGKTGVRITIPITGPYYVPPNKAPWLQWAQ